MNHISQHWEFLIMYDKCKHILWFSNLAKSIAVLSDKGDKTIYTSYYFFYLQDIKKSEMSIQYFLNFKAV